MAAIAWRERLQSLSLPPKEKGAIIQSLFAAKWGSEEGIQAFFDTCVECGGEEALISALQRMHHGEDVTEKKKGKIFIPRAQGEELVLVGRWFNLTQSSFNTIFPKKGYVLPFKGGHLDKDEEVLYFRDLVQGESYLLEDFGSYSSRLKTLENFNTQEMHACEQELAVSMSIELTVHGIAKNPITRDDLRVHCQGTEEEQEFDAVLLDGEHQAFIGSAKHVAHGTAEVEDMLNKVGKLADRARDIERYPSYAPFQGRALGCCIRIDTIKQAHQKAVKHLCFRKGIGLFQRSGAALAMQPIPFTGAQSLEPGFFNMVVRGIKRLAH